MSNKFLMKLKEEAESRARQLLVAYRKVADPESRTKWFNKCCNLQNALGQAEKQIDRLTAENNKMTDMLMAAGFIGKGTQIIGNKRYRELLKAEAELAELKKPDLPYGGDGPGITDEYGG